MSINGDIEYVNRGLVKTLDKDLTAQMLKEWRKESTSKEEGALLTEILERVMDGSLDG